MNLKKTTLALAIAAAASAPFAASADVKFSGKLDVLLTSVDEASAGSTANDYVVGNASAGSFDIVADDVEIDVTVVEKVGNVKYIGDIDLDFAQSSVDGGDQGDNVDTVDLDAARFVAVGSFGAFVIGHSPSGTYPDIYGAADVMSENTDIFSRQGTQFNNVLAWKTPNLGPVYAVVATYVNGGAAEDSQNLQGEDEFDLIATRIIYKAHGVKAGVSRITVENGSDTVRTAAGASYSNDTFSVGAFWEEMDTDNGFEQETIGLGATFAVGGNVTLKASYETSENISNVDERDGNIAAVGVDYSLAKNMTLYAEIGSGEVENVANADGDADTSLDNISMGVVVKF